MRRAVQLPVEPAVRLAQLRRLVQQLAVPLDHIVEHLDFFRRGVLRCQLSGEPLQRAAHRVKFGHLVVVQRGHDQGSAIPRKQGLRLKPL